MTVKITYKEDSKSFSHLLDIHVELKNTLSFTAGHDEDRDIFFLIFENIKNNKNNSSVISKLFYV